jgi:hypothetical protein
MSSMATPASLPHLAWQGAKAVSSWLHGLRDALKALLAVLVVLSAMGFGMYVQDTGNQATARSLVASGTTTYAFWSRLHVTYRHEKGGGYYDVDQVSVTLPGIERSVSLQLTQSPFLDNIQEGWQSPSDQTGYVAPFKVRYRMEPDGTVTAAGADDVEYWSGEGPDTGVNIGLDLMIGFGGLLATGLSVAGIIAGRALLARRDPRVAVQVDEPVPVTVDAQTGRAMVTSAFSLTAAAAAAAAAAPSRASRHIGEPQTLTLRDLWVQMRTTPDAGSLTASTISALSCSPPSWAPSASGWGFMACDGRARGTSTLALQGWRSSGSRSWPCSSCTC